MYYAGFWRRFAAYAIDSLLLSVLTAGAHFLLHNTLALLGIFLVLSWLYFALLEASPKQATLGKMALGILVTDMEGERISFGAATKRFFGKFISGVTFCIGFLMAGFTENKQALHDLIGGTLVLNLRSMREVPDTPQEQNSPREAYGDYVSAPAPVRPTLHGISGEFAGRSIPVDGRGLVLGRNPNLCNVPFRPGTPGISRRHCAVRYNRASGSFTVTDMGSTYGTFLESGVRIGQGRSAQLRAGERFYLATKGNLFEVRV